MTKLELVTPHSGLRESYLDYVAEIKARMEPAVPFVVGFDATDFEAFLGQLEACSCGIDIRTGYSAHTTYWLVRDDSEVVGVSNLRHTLTPALRRDGGNIGYGIRPSARGNRYGTAILGQTLRRADAMGLSEALVTCAKANRASARVILGNGGVFDSEEFLPELGFVLQRYWIKIS